MEYSCSLPGGRNSSSCTLILTEGDSAKTLAVSGLGVVGRDRYGVFPLKGKILNVREASLKQVRIEKIMVVIVFLLLLMHFDFVSIVSIHERGFVLI